MGCFPTLYHVVNYSWFGLQGDMIVDNKKWEDWNAGMSFIWVRSQDTWESIFTNYNYVTDVANS